jgi:Uma2 family endonuclease
MLVDGEIYLMAIPGPSHNSGVGLADYKLKAVFASGYFVRVQMPLVLGQHSDPVPDVAVAKGSPRDNLTHPTTALVVVEVADTSLDIDTGSKSQLYAAAGIADYWVVDLNNRLLIVHRDPQPDPSNLIGASYATVTSFAPGQSVTPVAAPTVTIPVADLLV